MNARCKSSHSGPAMKRLSPLPLLLFAASIHATDVSEKMAAPSFECPPAPATIHVVADGRMLRCAGPGHDAYRHLPFPDDASHWQHLLGLNGFSEPDLLSYAPPQAWPFRAIVVSKHPGARDEDRYFVFDQHGTVIDSNDISAIGEQMMEIRLSGVLLWPRSRVYYRVPATSALRAEKDFNLDARVAATSQYAMVIEGDTLCPVLYSRLHDDWQHPSAPQDVSAAYINGHCAQAFHTTSALIPDSQGQWLTYPGSSIDGLNMIWSVQRLDSPVRPIMGRDGTCLAQCNAD